MVCRPPPPFPRTARDGRVSRTPRMFTSTDARSAARIFIRAVATHETYPGFSDLEGRNR